MPGHALQVGEDRKMAAHADACRAVGVVFVPLVMETLDRWCDEAIRTIRRIGRLQGQRLGIHPPRREHPTPLSAPGYITVERKCHTVALPPTYPSCFCRRPGVTGPLACFYFYLFNFIFMYFIFIYLFFISIHYCNCLPAVRGDMGLDTLQSRRDRAKLKWWYKLATLPEDRYPKQLFNQEWNIKPRRGRQRKVWSRMVDDLFKSLDIDKSEWLEDIKHGDSSSASFMACVEECISERESRKFEEGLNTKVKLDMYKRFGKSVEFKKYLHGICDAGSRLLFKFRSGTHGLNEELGRHRRREGKTKCSLCGNECENVSHVLWECSAYSSTRASFMKKLQELLEDDYEDFESLENVEKSSYVLGSELWESKFDGLLALVKEYIVYRCFGNMKT